ncbi:MAG: S8 family serine peptidase, partial [Tepidisphaeraceae bacterium]
MSSRHRAGLPHNVRPSSETTASAFEALERRVFLAANPLNALKQSEASTRVNAKLLDLYDSVINGLAATQAARDEHLRVDAQERVAVRITSEDVATVAKGLARLGFVVTASFPKLHFVEGMIPVRALRVVGSIASKIGQFAILPSYAPVNLTGSANSQADFIMEADRVRNTLPAAINGNGVKIGVLSDSFDAPGGLGSYAADQASGDLPAGIQVLQDAAGTDEGRAMLQLIHDLAPGSPLAFATAAGGEGNFANNIRNLANPAIGNAKVIVDDIVYFAEPMFQDGVIAQAIDEVVTTRGVNYFTSAGNQASRAYESTNFQTVPDTIGGGAGVTGAFYDFDPGAGVDTRQRITVPGNTLIRLSFQWDDPFYTTSGVDTDLDLYLVDAATGAIVASVTSNNIASDTPGEVITFTTPAGPAMNLDLSIRRAAGPNPGRIKYVNYGSSGVSIVDFPTNSPTVVPHAAATNGQAVAAVPYYDQTNPESFTSKGTSTILFSPTGAPIAPQVRQTPHIAGIDGTNTTFFGSDFEGDGQPNFFGTSAAAPHVAAVAALVRQANPAFTPAQIYTRLQTTADDITSTGVGYDNLTGFGLVNAYDAVYPTVTPASVNFSDGLEGGALSAAYETRSTGAGRVLVTSGNSPFAGTRHLTLDSAVGLATPSLNEVTLHVNLGGPGTKTLSFRQKEFTDEDNVMPATFTSSSNSEGVALSVDGVNWIRIVSLTGAASTAAYTLNTFDLSAIAAAHGITLGADTRIRFQQYDTHPISGNDGMAFDDISVTSDIAPTVTGVFVAGTAWNANFLNFLATSGVGDATYGFRIDPSDQTNELPWTNLNKLSVRFSEDVVVSEDDLAVIGVNVASYGFAAATFSYDPVTFTATWTLAAPVAADKLLLDLDAAAASGVTDAAGNALDGEWTNPIAPAVSADTYPSGDGTPGGDFRFRLNVLPGDVNRSGGAVVGSDVTLTRNAQNFTPGTGLYTIFKDVNGTGSILGSDVTLVRNRQGFTLPGGEPVAPA